MMRQYHNAPLWKSPITDLRISTQKKEQAWPCLNAFDTLKYLSVVRPAQVSKANYLAVLRLLKFANSILPILSDQIRTQCVEMRAFYEVFISMEVTQIHFNFAFIICDYPL